MFNIRLGATMPAASYASVHTRSLDQGPPDNFWAECRRKAIELNIPAWKLAEEYYQHERLDGPTRTK